MSAFIKKKTAQNALLLVALCLLMGAVLLKLYIDRNNPFDQIIAMLDAYGYTVREDELYVEGEYRQTTIQALFKDVELAQAVEASEAGGFPSRIDRKGDVVLLLLATRAEDIITLYYLDGQPELCFVQTVASHAVKPLGEKP